jgi:hypothetical protein
MLDYSVQVNILIGPLAVDQGASLYQSSHVCLLKCKCWPL